MLEFAKSFSGDSSGWLGSTTLYKADEGVAKPTLLTAMTLKSLLQQKADEGRWGGRRCSK